MEKSKKHLHLSVDSLEDSERIAKICHALSSKSRVDLLRSILVEPKTVQTLSEELHLPISNISRYAEDMSDAGIIKISYRPSKKNKIRFYTLLALSCEFSMEPLETVEPPSTEYILEMPIGMFTSCDISFPCGMTDGKNQLEEVNAANMFFLPQRCNAELIWFNCGFLGYDFPIQNKPSYNSISFSFEICSEAPGYNTQWPSDITVRIDGIDLATFTVTGDFGGSRGKFTPTFWPIYCTQFGVLKKLTVNGEGVFLDNVMITNRITINDLSLNEKKSVHFEIGVKEDAENCGGLNLFGKNFGDYNQAIIMQLK